MIEAHDNVTIHVKQRGPLYKRQDGAFAAFIGRAGGRILELVAVDVRTEPALTAKVFCPCCNQPIAVYCWARGDTLVTMTGFEDDPPPSLPA